MQISQKQFDEIKHFHKNCYGRDITVKEIQDGAMRLMEIAPIIYPQLTQEDLLMVEESRKEIKEFTYQSTKRKRKLGKVK